MLRTDSVHSDVLADARVRLWKSMMEDFELGWLSDAPASTARRVIDLTLFKIRRNRAQEDAWRTFLNDRRAVDF